MKERPILMCADMVVATLREIDPKTQTRREVKNPDFFGCFTGDCPHEKQVECDAAIQAWAAENCPYGKVGDRLWVKETHGFWSHSVESVGIEYPAGGDDKIVDFPNKVGMPSLEVQCRKNHDGKRRMRPSIFMPRWASRITLEIVAVRVEQLQAITEADVRAEGVKTSIGSGMIEGETVYEMTTNSGYSRGSAGARLAYQDLWESINGKDAWDKNPWVWVITFKKL